MAIVIIAPSKQNLPEWKSGISKHLQKHHITDPVWLEEEVEDPEAVRMAITWRHRPQSLYAYPNLAVVASMGAGVDHILSDPNLPEHWQITRIIDPMLSQSMSNYLLAVVLARHKKLWNYKALQEQKRWGYTETPERALSIGILGLGVLGQDVGRKLVNLGFPVFGYSQAPKEIEGITSFAGLSELPAFLSKVNVLICLLPLTPDTRNFLNLSFFRQCQKGTYLINVARGQHVVEEDLLSAIDEGFIAGATLDVFQKEPLPKTHPFWDRSEISITPHIASITQLDAAIPQLADNYAALRQGKALAGQVDRKKGY